MISDGTFDLMRERWAQTIPEQYRNTGKDRDIYHLPENKTSAIIAPPPPPQLLERFLAAVSRKMHLTQAQLQARAAREACGHNAGRKLDINPAPRRRNRKRSQPGLPLLP